MLLERSKRHPRVIPDLERQLDAERRGELGRPGSGADEHPLEAPRSRGGLHDALPVDGLDFLPDEPVAEPRDQCRHSLPRVNCPATHVVQRRPAGRPQHREKPPLLLLVDDPVLDPRLRQQGGEVLGLSRGEEDAFVPDERPARELAPLVPAPAGATHELHQIRTVMGVAEDARVARGLPAPGLGGFEAEGVHPGTRESVGRGQPDDSGADDGDFGSALHPPR
jgi:hypothetical protein